jgi:hypothetical protein
MRSTVRPIVRASFLLLSALAFLAAHPARAAEGKAYGKPFTKDAIEVSVAKLLESPEDYVGKRVRVKGVVTDVCTHRGCWILIGGEDGKTVRFKVQDGEIVFPVESKGKRAEAEGIFTKIVLSVEDQVKRGKHHAKREGKPFDPATITGPKTIYQIKGEGALLK